MRFMLGDFTSAGAEILDSRNMSVAYLDVDTIEAAQSHVDFRNLISEKLRRLDLDITELEARLRADFGKGTFSDAA